MFETVKTPCYIVDEKKLRSNLEILKRVQEEADCKILLAQKAFSMFRVYPLIGEYLAGTTASGLYEARLGREEMGKENHVFAPAFRSEDMEELDEICDHVIFNSMAQFEKHKGACRHDNIAVITGHWPRLRSHIAVNWRGSLDSTAEGQHSRLAAQCYRLDDVMALLTATGHYGKTQPFI